MRPLKVIVKVEVVRKVTTYNMDALSRMFIYFNKIYSDVALTTDESEEAASLGINDEVRAFISSKKVVQAPE